MPAIIDPWNGAQWICARDAAKATNLYLQFAKRFKASSGPALVRISAVSQYRLSVNGREIARGPAVGSPGRYYYHTHELDAGILKSGENLVTVLLFHDGAATETVQGFHYGDPGLIVSVEASGGGCVSDNTWKVRRAPCYSPQASLVSKWGGYKEYYHGDKDDAWESPAFDHAGWDTTEVAAPPESDGFVHKLVPLDVPFLEERTLGPRRVVELRQGLGMVSLADGDDFDTPFAYRDQPIVFERDEPYSAPAVVFDYGNIHVGYPEIEISGPPCVVEVWYGETLDMWRLDGVRLVENGSWRAFQRRAYRFIEFRFIGLGDEPVTLTRVAHHNAWYAYDERGKLETSDGQFNHMLEVSRHTLRANTSYHYEDCPIREQALWVMDMRIMARINAYLHGNHELNAKCIRQALAIQRDNGFIAATGPKENNMNTLDFLFHLVGTVWEHYERTGDRELVAEAWPALRRVDAFVQTMADADGLLDSTRVPWGNLFLDWSTEIERWGKTAIHNALYVIHCDHMALLGGVAGDDDASEFTARAKALRAAAHKCFFIPKQGVYRDAWRNGEPIPTISQQANMAMILAAIPPGNLIAKIMEKVWESDAYPRPYGPSYYLIVCDALAKIGRHDAIEQVLRDYWGPMLDRGATTWWEVFNPGTPEWVYPHPLLGNVPTYEMDWIPVSCCHGWSGVPAYVIPMHFLGVDLSRMHEKRVAIDPKLPGLFEEARYDLPLAGGMLRLRYHAKGAGYKIDILEKPKGVRVDIA
jgi:alpha-L-rhamnosidase